MSVLTAEHITKSFGGVRVLDDITLALHSGVMTGLVGENGAGKSTLIKIITGLLRPDSGRILIDDHSVGHWTDHHVREAGVAVIHQELLLVPELTVAENIMLGDPSVRGRGTPAAALGVRDDEAGNRRARELLAAIGITDLDVATRVRDISPSRAQMVLIARSLRRTSRVLILDEPTAALAPSERHDLFALLRRLLQRGTAILFVSHHLQEVQDLCSEVLVLRNGKAAAHLEGEQISVPAMIQAMLDRSLENQFPPVEHEPGEATVLEVSGVSRAGVLDDVDLHVRAGEILGVTGLLGAGKTELARALVGADPAHGAVEIDGRPRRIRGPRDGVRAGLLLVPEERKAQAIFPELSVYHNGIVSLLAKGVRHLGWRGLLPAAKAQRETYRRIVGQLGVRHRGDDQLASRLSGGNQQKLVIGRALACSPHVLVLDEPTRGVDVGSKREIYRIIVEQAATGLAVVIFTSDTREVLALAHRIVVMREGRVAAEVRPADVTNEELTALLSPSASSPLRSTGAA